MAAAAWRILPRAIRMGVLGVLAVIAAPTTYRAAAYAEGLVEDAIVMRRVAAELAPQRAAMRVPPEEAARRAIAAGNLDFLAISGFIVTVPGVGNVCLEDARGWMVIRGTTDAFRSAGHMRFQREAYGYAVRYNAELIRQLELDRAELALPLRTCAQSAGDREARPRYWPDGAHVH